MTKTSLTSIVGAACGLASFVLGSTLISTEAVADRPVAWEQPPVCIPKPSGGIRVLTPAAAGAVQVAWEQPPACIPKPSGGIRVLTNDATV